LLNRRPETENRAGQLAGLLLELVESAVMGLRHMYDDGPTLLATCDRCSEGIMAFGLDSSTRTDLENRIVAEGWQLTEGAGSLCQKCSGLPPDIQQRHSLQSRGVAILKAPD